MTRVQASRILSNLVENPDHYFIERGTAVVDALVLAIAVLRESQTSKSISFYPHEVTK